MSVSRITIEEFREVICEEFGEDLTYEQAEKILTNCVGYFGLLAKLRHHNKEAEYESFNGANKK